MCDGATPNAEDLGDVNPLEYDSYLKIRPAKLELDAIEFVAETAVKYDK